MIKENLDINGQTENERIAIFKFKRRIPEAKCYQEIFKLGNSLRILTDILKNVPENELRDCCEKAGYSDIEPKLIQEQVKDMENCYSHMLERVE